MRHWYKKKNGLRSRVCNEVNIGIPLHWSGCFFLLIQCSYGITVYIKLKVWFLVCWLIWAAKFEYNELKNRPITKKGLSFFKLPIKETVHFGSVTISLPLVYWALRNHPCENYALRWTLGNVEMAAFRPNRALGNIYNHVYFISVYFKQLAWQWSKH